MKTSIARVGMLMCLFLPAVAHAQRVPRDVAAIAAEGERALEEERFGDALEAFSKAVELAPQTAWLWFGKGLSAYMLGQRQVAESSLAQALALQPRFVEASVLLGELQFQSGRVSEAVDTYEAALKHAPREAALVERLDQLRRDSRFSERLYKSRGSHFRVLFEGPADEAIARRAVEFLEAAYWRVGSTLSVHPSGSITVVLYTIEQFRDITRAPQWAGGLYDGQIRVAVKGALEHLDDLERLLVHEYVHAVVAQVGGRNVPSWVNEGLATAMEPGGIAWASSVVARSRGGLRLDQLHQNFTRLGGDHVELAYAESALAVRRLIDMRGAAAVVMLLRDLQRGVRFETAFHQRLAIRYEDFLSMLQR